MKVMKESLLIRGGRYVDGGGGTYLGSLTNIIASFLNFSLN